MNWTAITIANLKDSAHGAIIDTAQSTATGTEDPVVAVIRDVTARIRAVVSGGNQLDQDKTKIPNSLVNLASRMCIRHLKQRIGYDLSADERDQRKEDNDYVKQIADNKIIFETPDAPAGSAEMQPADEILEQQTGGNIDTPGGDARKFTREKMDGL